MYFLTLWNTLSFVVLFQVFPIPVSIAFSDDIQYENDLFSFHCGVIREQVNAKHSSHIDLLMSCFYSIINQRVRCSPVCLPTFIRVLALAMQLGPHKDRRRKSDEGGTWSKVFAVLLQAQFGDSGKRLDGCRDACGILLLTLVNYFIDFQCQETNFVSIEQTKHLSLLRPFVAIQRRGAQFDEMGPKAHIRRRFHSLYGPSTTSYKSLFR